MDDLTYQQCLEAKDPVPPQDLPQCVDCIISVGDCMRLTSVIPYRCPYYAKYQKEWEEYHEKKKDLCIKL